jgi:hypothetical protein
VEEEPHHWLHGFALDTWSDSAAADACIYGEQEQQRYGMLLHGYEPAAPTESGQASGPQIVSRTRSPPANEVNRTRHQPATLVLRGLPFTAKEADVAALVAKVGAHFDAVHILQDTLGRPSGFCVLKIGDPWDLQRVQKKLHMQRLGGRYVEALLPERCERWVASAIAAQWKP